MKSPRLMFFILTCVICVFAGRDPDEEYVDPVLAAKRARYEKHKTPPPAPAKTDSKKNRITKKTTTKTTSTRSVRAPDAPSGDQLVFGGSVFRPGVKNISLGVTPPFLGEGWFNINLTAEYNIFDLVSAGLEVGALYGEYRFGNFSYTYWGIPVMGRATFHPFNLPALSKHISVKSQVDAYIGVGVGWLPYLNAYEPGPFNASYTGPAWDHYSHGIFTGIVGVRFYPLPTLGIYAESTPYIPYIGGGTAAFGWLSGGITYQF